MTRKSIDTDLDVTTWIVEAELADGMQVCFPLADAALISVGRNGSALVDQRLFLEEHLPRQRPEVLARFAFPADTRLQQFQVQVSREDLPPRVQLKTPITFAVVIIPHGRDHWVVVPALHHTFHVSPGEDLEQAVTAEVRRMAVASEPTPLEFAHMLPALGYRLEPMELVIDRSDKLVPGTARAVRKKVMQLRQRADALEVLASVGIPLHLDPAVLQGPVLCGMQRELDLLHGLLSGKRRMGVMLVGPALSGKTALFHGWLRRERDAGRERLAFATSGVQLVAGMSGLGQWQERARRVLLAAEQLDAVLYFDNLADLFGDRPEGKVDLAGAVRPFVQQGRVRLLGELRPQTLDLLESRQASFVGALQRVRIEPMDAAGAVEVVRSRVEHATRGTGEPLSGAERSAQNARQHPNRPNLAPSAVQLLVDLVERYLPYQSHPGKAVRLLEEVRAVHEQRRRGEEDWDEEAALIDEGELLELFSMQSGIPLFLLRQDQGLKLQDVVQGLGRRLIGQEQAVRRVAETICMVKANLQGRGKPLATFLFVGPTGVGKTEMARSLAQFLFGSEDRLVRFDMSEFMDAGAAQRLIQGTDRAEGMLTRRIRQQPFSVLLLDEFEKAHPAVFDLLLQVCGEGRLTDTAGRTAQFDNTMIIMTSNLGAAARRAPIGIAPPARDDAAYYEEQVCRAFRPEFVNRLDRIITFHALTRDQVRRVASLILKRIGRRRGLAELGIELRLSEEALALLSRDGYSEEYGARQLRRHLEQQLIAPAAQMLAELGSRARGATLQVATETDPEPLPTGRSSRLTSRSQVTGLRLALVRGQGMRSHLARSAPHASAAPPLRAQRGVDTGPLEAICTLRREVQRRMALETVQEVKDRMELLVTQLAAVRQGGKAGGEASLQRHRAREAGELHSELHGLQQVWRQVDALREDVELAEEMALTALFEDEDPQPYLTETRQIHGRFLEALFPLLLVLRSRRDQATVLAQELDERGGLDHWLRALLGSSRGWSIQVHVDGGEAAAADRWPAARRWGPSRDPTWGLEQLDRPDRRFRNVLLRVSGPYAGVCLALERGTHCYEGVANKPVRVSVELVARRTELTDEEWLGAHANPLPPTRLGSAKHREPARRFEAPGGPCHLEHGGVLRLGLDRYWAHFERVGTEQLLAHIDRRNDEDLDPLFGALLPDQPLPGSKS